MKILLHGLNFAPELTGIGKYSGEMSAYLAAHGHEVRVVTAPPYYPQWRIARGYSGREYRREIWEGMRVYRCPLWVPRRPSGLTRLLHLASFALSSLPVMLAQVDWRPDLVMGIAPAIAGAPVALLTARLTGSRAWLHIQDFEVEAALELNLLRMPAWAGRWLRALESGLIRQFDRVSTISERMLEQLWQKGAPPERTRFLPNWVDPTLIYPITGPNPYRQAWGLSDSQKVVLYAGNLGQKQGLETIVEAARLLQEEQEICFILCGEGAARPLIERAAAGLSNLRLESLQPPERLNELLNLAEIHVLPQRADAADLVMPSKLGNMLASGRPVIAAARAGTEVAQVLEQAGLVIPPEDPAALAEAILRLSRDAALQAELGQRGRQYVLNHWAKEQVLGGFLGEIEALVLGKPL